MKATRMHVYNPSD